MYRFMSGKTKLDIFSYILLSIGYILSTILISLNISLVQNAIKVSIDSTHGNSKHQSNIIMQANHGSISYESLIDVLKNNVNTARIEINGIEDHFSIDSITPTQVFVIPFAYKIKPEWLPNQIKGRFISYTESISNEKVAVIGNILAMQYFPKGISNDSYIRLGDDNFKVIGTVGKDDANITDYERNIYIPLQTLPQKYNKKLENISINILSNKQSSNSTKNIVIQELNKKKS